MSKLLILDNIICTDIHRVIRSYCATKDSIRSEETAVLYNIIHGIDHVPFDSECTTMAIKCDQLEILKYMHRQLPLSSFELAETAAIWNRKSILKWLLSINVPVTEWVANILAINGNLDMIRLLNSDAKNIAKPLFGPNTMDYAARYGRLQIVKWLHFNKLKHKTLLYACKLVIEGNHIAVFDWFTKYRKQDIHRGLYTEAIRYDNLPVLQCLYKNLGKHCTDADLSLATNCRRVEIVKFLYHEHKELFDAKYMRSIRGTEIINLLI